MFEYEYGRPSSAPPANIHSDIFLSFTPLSSDPSLTFTSPSYSTQAFTEGSSLRPSFESITSYTFSTGIFPDHDTKGLKRPFSVITSTMKSRALGLSGPLFFRRGRAPGNSTSSLPSSIGTKASSTFSKRSKGLFSKVPKMFEFDLPFGVLKLHRISKAPKVTPGIGNGVLTKRHRKPSTLDFRCIGMVGEDEFYFRGTASNGLGAPRIHWVKPDIHSDWKKDWFTGVCC